MTLLNKRAQSTGEYAILFAIVLGGGIAMQNYVRNRIAGRLQQEANVYANGVNAVNMVRSSDSLSASSASMSSASVGTFRSDSDSQQIQTNPAN